MPALELPRAEPVAHQRVLSLCLLAGLALTWGLNWPAMKFVLEELPVLTFRSLCLWVSGPALLAIAALGGERLHVPRGERLPLAVASFFNITMWHLCTALGLSMIAAGRASMIAFTMPLWSALLANRLLGERLTVPRVLGLLMGLGGLVLLLLPAAGRLGAAPVGALFVLAAAVSWAAGTVATKKVRWSMSVAQLTGWQLFIGGIPIVASALVFDPPDAVLGLSPGGFLVLCYTVTLPLIFAQWAWFKVLHMLPAGVASIGTLAVPVVGVLSSALLLGEQLGVGEVLALLLIVAALALVLLAPSPTR